MTGAKSALASKVGLGAAAGLAGTCVMIAMRSFDAQYAPKTIPTTQEDPGAFLVKVAERATGTLPRAIEQSAAMATHLGYGSTMGIIYALWRGRGHKRSALIDGPILGAIVYAAGHMGLLPGLGLEKPAWKQSFPEIGGELLRHVAYGVATAAAFGTSDALL